MISNRHEELSQLDKYLTHCDNEITMILQSLQWDRSSLITEPKLITCVHNAGHTIPLLKREEHESKCWLNCQGYSKKDMFLPEPLDCKANTIVKLSAENIKHIIEEASQNDPNFKKGNGWDGPAPLTLERLQATYTADERRAIHGAVVASVPSCHDLSDLVLLDTNSVKAENERKSRVEILSELRDMKRRRTKYRVAAKTKKYSDVLRDVIKTQMELYTDVQINKEKISDDNTSLEINNIKRESRSSIEKNTSNTEYNKSHFSKIDKSRNIQENDRYRERSKCNNLLTTECDRKTDDRRRDREKYSDTRNEARKANEKSYCYDGRTDKRNDRSGHHTERLAVSNDRISRHTKYVKRDKYHREYDRNGKKDRFRDDRRNDHEYRSDRYRTSAGRDFHRRDYTDNKKYDEIAAGEVKVKCEYDRNRDAEYGGQHKRGGGESLCGVRVKREELE